MICERMLREQEAALRAEYEAALCGKLAEQYESFVRFSQDQVQRRHLQPQDISCKFPIRLWLYFDPTTIVTCLMSDFRFIVMIKFDCAEKLLKKTTKTDSTTAAGVRGHLDTL